MTVTTLSPSPADELGTHLTGRVITPADPDFDSACAAWNLSFTHRPALVVLPRTAQDVAAAVRHAVRHDLRVTVQTTGHGVVRPAAGSMLILTHGLHEVTVDPDVWTARIGGGAKWERVLGPAQAAGLAPLLGSTPDVGAVGYTLGGGMGWLARRYGLSIDRVRWFEIVTADAEVRRVSDEVEPELFWALRGGGAGSLGVVTAMEIDLVPVTRVYAGNLFYPVEAAAEVGDRYRAWLEIVPDELTSSVVFMNYPPFEEVPEPIRGRSFVIVRGCFAGSDEDGEALLSYWRGWREPLLDLWGPMPFSDVALISNDPVDPLGGHSTSDWLAHLGPEVVEILSRRVFPVDGPPSLVFGEIRHAGGAIADPPRPAAYGNRDQRHVLQMVGIAEDPEGLARLETYLAEVRAELAPHATGRTYLNFLEGEEKAARAPEGFDPDTWARLRAVKAAADPHNRFADGLPLA